MSPDALHGSRRARRGELESVEEQSVLEAAPLSEMNHTCFSRRSVSRARPFGGATDRRTAHEDNGRQSRRSSARMDV